MIFHRLRPWPQQSSEHHMGATPLGLRFRVVGEHLQMVLFSCNNLLLVLGDYYTKKQKVNKIISLLLE